MNPEFSPEQHPPLKQYFQANHPPPPIQSDPSSATLNAPPPTVISISISILPIKVPMFLFLNILIMLIIALGIKLLYELVKDK